MASAESYASGTSAPGSSSASSTRAANGAFTLEFSPDGRTLAVSGFEPVASLWDVGTGTQIGPQLTAGDRRTMIDLSADGRHLLETHGNGQGAVWDVDPESWERRACDARQPHADPRGVGGVPPRPALRAGLLIAPEPD